MTGSGVKVRNFNLQETNWWFCKSNPVFDSIYRYLFRIVEKKKTIYTYCVYHPLQICFDLSNFSNEINYIASFSFFKAITLVSLVKYCTNLRCPCTLSFWPFSQSCRFTFLLFHSFQILFNRSKIWFHSLLSEY